MTIDDKTLYARIKDPNGLADGLRGFADMFHLATDRAELLILAGEAEAPFCVEVPRYPEGHEFAGQFLHCAGWRYEDGAWVDPSA